MKRTINSVKQLEDFGRIRLSESYFMRDFLFSDIAAIHGLSNMPDDPHLAQAAGERLCQDLLKPLQKVLGRLAIRSAYRSCTVNAFGNENVFIARQMSETMPAISGTAMMPKVGWAQLHVSSFLRFMTAFKTKATCKSWHGGSRITCRIHRFISFQSKISGPSIYVGEKNPSVGSTAMLSPKES